MNLPLVSIVITTKNEEQNIENCLKSILGQSYKNIEIIVVDNFSTDKTKEIALKYTDKVFDKGPERSAQRNYGVQKSSGEYFLYLDADMILSENVISECVEKFENWKLKIGNFKLAALYIPEIIMGDNFWCKVRRFERSFYNATCIDCVRFIKKDKFLTVDKFDEKNTGTEDWDLDKKIRLDGKVDIIKSPLYHNEGKFNLRNYLNKKNYYIKSLDTYVKKWGRNDPDIKKQIGFYYRYFGVFLENGKWKKLLTYPILMFGMYFLKGLIGIIYLINKKKYVKKNFEKMFSNAMNLNKKNILNFLEKNKDAKLLCLGCDDGYWTLNLAKKIGTKNIYGIDIVDERLDIAKKNGIITKNSDLNNTFPFDNNFFDIIHANQVIEHITSLDNFISEIHRVLKHGGYVIISTENGSSWHNIFASIMG